MPTNRRFCHPRTSANAPSTGEQTTVSTAMSATRTAKTLLPGTRVPSTFSPVTTSISPFISRIGHPGCSGSIRAM